jgi:hypothetical protein
MWTPTVISSRVSGSITAAAGVWQTLVDVTGSGAFDSVMLIAGAAVTGTTGLRVTIDGVAFEATAAGGSSGAVWSTPYFDQVDYAYTMHRLFPIQQRIAFDTSLKIEGIRGSAAGLSWYASYATEIA